jgi:hypothetical protein
MRQEEFEKLITDTTKQISGDIFWIADEDHSPAVEFRIAVTSQIEYTFFVRGSYNPSCNNVGEKHKHRWKESLRDKEAYVPEDITASVTDPIAVWQQFCSEAQIIHKGVMHAPPPLQLGLV